jgi:hypothetical protein
LSPPDPRAVGDQAARWPQEEAADVRDGKRFDLDYRSRPGPDAGDGPWTVELAIEVTPLDA